MRPRRRDRASATPRSRTSATISRSARHARWWRSTATGDYAGIVIVPRRTAPRSPRCRAVDDILHHRETDAAAADERPARRSRPSTAPRRRRWPWSTARAAAGDRACSPRPTRCAATPRSSNRARSESPGAVTIRGGQRRPGRRRLRHARLIRRAHVGRDAGRVGTAGKAFVHETRIAAAFAHPTVLRVPRRQNPFTTARTCSTCGGWAKQ